MTRWMCRSSCMPAMMMVLIIMSGCGDSSKPSTVPAKPRAALSDTQAALGESLAEAIEAAESILKVAPNDPEALLAAALAAEHLGLADKAVHYYTLLQAATQETEYLQKLTLLQLSSRPDEAAKFAVKFFEQGGTDDGLRLWLVRYLADKKEYMPAYALTDKLTPPVDRVAREMLRDLCLRASSASPAGTIDALTALRRAATFAPLPADLSETAALTLLTSGDASAARDVLRTYPGPAYILRAQIADKLQDPKEAMGQRLKYFNAGGSDPQELFALLELLGRAPPAQKVAEKLWSTKELNAQMRMTAARKVAQFYREATPPDTTAEIRFLEEARGVGDPEMLERLADLQQALGNARAALSALRTRYPQGIPESKIDFYVSQALSAGETDEALKVARTARADLLSYATRRRIAEMLNSVAESHIGAGRPAMARQSAMDANAMRPDGSSYRILARISLLEADTPAAMAHLTSALKLLPGDPMTNYVTGKVLVGMGRGAEAKTYLQSAYASRVREEDLPLMLGRILYAENAPTAYSMLNEYAQAKAGQVSPDVMEMLGRSAVTVARTSDAATWLERRLATGPDEKIAGEYLDALTASGQKAKALGVARMFVVKYPMSRPILHAASNVFDYVTDSVVLLKTLESLAAIEPDAVQKAAAQRRILDLKIRMGRTAEADALLTTLLEKFPDDLQILTAAWGLRKGTPAAEPILRRLGAIKSPDDPIQLIRARQLLEDDNVSGALTVVNEYMARRRDDPDALTLRAEIRVRAGDVMAAADDYRALLKIRKDETARQWLVRHIYDQAMSSLAGGKPLENSATLYSEALRLLGTEERHRDFYEIYGKVFARDPSYQSLAVDAFQRELKFTVAARADTGPEREKRMRLTETLANLYLSDGQVMLAKDMFIASQSAGNATSGFLRNFARLLSRLGEDEDAEKQYRKLLAESPYDRESNLFLARRSVDLGRVDDSIRALEALRLASPEDSAVLDALGRSYMAARRFGDASQAWQKLADRTGSLRHISQYADALYEAGRFQTALREYRTLYSSGVSTITQMRRLADLEQGQGNWAAAEEIILKLLRVSGTEKDREALADVLRRMGERAVRQGSAYDAARSAERLMALRENDVTAFLLMGRAKLLEGRTVAAMESFSRARDLAPRDPRPALGLAEVELRAGRVVAAIDYAQRAIQLDPAFPEAYSVLGAAYQKQGEVKKAYDALKNAIVHSKNRVTAHVRMGDLFLQYGKYNVALQEYRRALAVDPKNAVAHLRHAVALHKLGFSENAMKELMQAMDLDPAGAGAEASVLLSEIFIEHGDLARARELLESASRRPSSPPAVVFRLGELARRNGEYARSVQLFKDALVASSDRAFTYDVLNALGLSLSALNDENSAEKTFMEATRLVPERSEAFLNLALLYRSRKNFVAAVNHASKAISASRNNPDGYKLLGLIYYEAGWQKESLSAFRESLKLSPDQPDIVNLVRGIEAEQETE